VLLFGAPLALGGSLLERANELIRQISDHQLCHRNFLANQLLAMLAPGGASPAHRPQVNRPLGAAKYPHTGVSRLRGRSAECARAHARATPRP